MPSFGRDVEQLELSHITGENVKGYNHFRKLLDIFLDN